MYSNKSNLLSDFNDRTSDFKCLKPVDFLIIVKDFVVHQHSHPTGSQGVTNPSLRWLLVRALRSVRDRISVPLLLAEHTHTSLYLWPPTFIRNKQTTNWTMTAWIHHSLVFPVKTFILSAVNPNVTHYLRQWQGGKVFLAGVSRSSFPQMALKETVFPMDEF